MSIRKERLAITTIVGGTGTAYSRPFSGEVVAIYVEKGDLAATTDLVITAGTEDAAILTITDLNASAWYHVRAGACGQTGAALVYIAAGQPVPVKLPIDGMFKVVAAQGGDLHTGYLTFYVED